MLNYPMYSGKSKLLFILIGVGLGLASIFISFKLTILGLACLCLVIFAFFYLEISIALFILFMAIVPGALWSNGLILLAAVFFTCIYLAQILSNKREWLDIRTLPASLIIFMFTAFLSLFVSWAPLDSLRVFAIFISCVTIAILIQRVVITKQTLEVFINFLFLAVFLTSVYGILQYKLGIEVRPDLVDLNSSQGLSRLYSTFDNPNNYGEFLVLLIPICASYILNCKSDLKRLVYFLAICPSILALLLTYSRSSYIAIVAAAGMYILLVNRRLVPFFIIAFFVSIPFWPQSVIDRILTIGKDSSSAYRFLIWEGALGALRDNWFSGVGMGPLTFANTFRNFVDPKASTAMHSHNLFLQVWLEMGICGLISFVVFTFRNLKNCISLTLQDIDKDVKIYLAGFAASITGIVVIGMVEYVWFYPRVMLTFWVVLGLTMATVNIARGKTI